MAEETERLARRWDLRDAAFVVGAALVAVGLWLVYPPAAIIVLGLLVIAGAILSART
jgi:hypothetical protein